MQRHFPDTFGKESKLIELSIELGGGQGYAGKFRLDELERVGDAIRSAEEKWEEYNTALDVLAGLGLKELTGDTVPKEDAPAPVKPAKIARVQSAPSRTEAGIKYRFAGHKCCGSKGSRHKKDCTGNEGTLPPDDDAVLTSTAEAPRAVRCRAVRCTECDWKGKIGPTVDIMDTRCGNCKERTLIEI